jgi:hypothetical protein
MKILIFLLLLAVTLAKRTYLPNVYVGYTIDMTQGEPGTGLSDPQSALKLPIIELTRSGRNQIYINGVLEIVPDQIIAIADPGMQTTSETEVYLSVFDVQKELSEAYSLSAKGMVYPWMFGASATVTDFKEYYKESAKLMAETTLIVTTYKAQILPESQNYTQNWLSNTKNLPTEYNSNTCPKFKYFLSEYGTHMITQVLSGGSVFMQTTFSETLTVQKSVKQISEDISTQFFFLTSSVKLTEQQEEELEQLNAIYTSTVSLKGGDSSKFYVNETQEWQATVPISPILLKYEIIPLYKLVSKSQQNALELATAAYFGSTITPGWKDESPYDFPVSYLTCCNYNEYVYCTGGGTNMVLMYDPSTSMWIKKASMQYVKSQAGLLCIPSLGKIVSIGGANYPDNLLNVEVYDVVGNFWSNIANLPVPYYTNSNDNIIYHNGLIYVLVSSYNLENNTFSQLTYSFVTNEWSFLSLYIDAGGTIPNPFPGISCSFYINKDTVISLMDQEGLTYNFIFLNFTVGIVQYYSILTPGPFTENGPITQIGNNVYVLGGYYNWGAAQSSQVWKYNILTNNWSLVTSLPFSLPYYGFSFATTGTNIHIVGGVQDHYNQASHYVYTPVFELAYC